MISDNYAQSQICLNEMGAAWATNRDVIPIIFPNVKFDQIGWLYNVCKGIKLNDKSALDSIFEIANDKYGYKLKVSAWNIYKEEFLDSIKTIDVISSSTEIVIINDEDEELDFLDYREAFDQNIQLNIDCMGQIRAATSQCTENINRNNKNLNNLTNNPNATPAQARTILLKYAHDYDNLSDVYDKMAPLMKDYFGRAIDAGIKMRNFSSLYEEDVNNEREAVAGLIQATEELLQATMEGKAIFENDKTNLDKTLNKAKKRLIKCYDQMIETLQHCITKANELLNYT